MTAIVAALALATVTNDWSVKKLQFSAVSIGVAMKDHTTGWSSFTNGAESIKITKTTDGGNTWTRVANQTNALMIMGVDVAKEPKLDVVSTGMAATSFSTDGDHFKGSLFGPFVSQSIKAYDGGRVVVATESGVCMSKTAGLVYACKKASGMKTPGRYAAAPSDDVIYLTAGQWPSHANATAREVQLTANLRLTNRSFATGNSRLSLESGARMEEASAPPPAPATGYAAQILKSSDGGKTWESLFFDQGNFYFNGIDCVDETHCVAVGEGFGHDGSASPGARVYVTTDGKTFTMSHHEAVDGASLMTAKMFDGNSHVAGGKLAKGISLHTADGGKTYAAKGSKISGQSITSMSFVTPTHGFATTVNALQICSLLEWGEAPQAN